MLKIEANEQIAIEVHTPSKFVVKINGFELPLNFNDMATLKYACDDALRVGWPEIQAAEQVA